MPNLFFSIDPGDFVSIKWRQLQRGWEMRKLLILCAVFLALVGCATSPQSMSSIDDRRLCRSYGVYAASPFFSALATAHKDEINRRKLISENEWDLARSKKITLGMGLCAMYASWGAPDRENRTVGSYGDSIQHVYNRGYKYIKPSYVYTQNGKVRSWQD